MMSLHYCAIFQLLLTILKGVSCEELTPDNDEESSLEGSTVTLSYKYSKQATGGDYFFWYQQYPGKPPEFLISHLGTGRPISDPVSGLSFKVSEDKTRMDLQISSAAVTHSALYYCAVRPGANQNKITFGSGTRVNIEPHDEYKPSYYTVEGNDTTACLATGFSRHNATQSDDHKDLFSETEAVRISEDSLYNQVAVLSNGETCEIEGQGSDSTKGESLKCEDTLEPDPTVNFMSLTVLGLRLLLMKTIVFNGLMTLRLWMSQ